MRVYIFRRGNSVPLEALDLDMIPRVGDSWSANDGICTVLDVSWAMRSKQPCVRITISTHDYWYEANGRIHPRHIIED